MKKISFSEKSPHLVAGRFSLLSAVRSRSLLALVLCLSLFLSVSTSTFAAKPSVVKPRATFSNPVKVIPLSTRPFIRVSSTGVVGLVADSYTGNSFVTFADSNGRFLTFGVVTVASNYPTGTFDAAGNFHMVWTDRGADGYFHAYYVKIPPTGNAATAAPVDIGSQAGISTYAQFPSIAYSKDGTLYVGVEENRSSAGIFSSSDGGATWGNNRITGKTPAGNAANSFTRVAVDSNGNPHMVFCALNGGSGTNQDVFSYDRDSSGNWTISQVDVAGTPGGRAFYSDIAAGPNGDLQAVWEEDLGPGATAAKEVSTSHYSSSSKQWVNQVINVSQSSGGVSGATPSTTIDANGVIWVAWSSLGGSAGVQYATSTNNGQSFSAPLAAIPSNFARGGQVDIANGPGKVYVVGQLDDGSLYGSWQANIDIPNNSTGGGGGTPTPTPTPSCATPGSQTTTSFTPPITGSYTYNLPFQANQYTPSGQTAGCFTTYTAIQNLGSQPANLNFYYFDQNGNSVAVPSGTCVSVPVFGECTPPNAFVNGNYGSGVVVSSQPLNVIVSEATPLGGSAYPVSAGAANQLVAPFAINNAIGGFATQLTVFNPSSAIASISVNFYDQNGNIQNGATQNFSLRPFTAKTLDQTVSGSNLSSGFYGWAAISGNGNLISAQILEQNPNTRFVAIANAQLQPSLPVSSTSATIYAPAIYNGAFGGYITGANLINPNSTAATVNITYYDNNGNRAPSQSFTINPNSIQAIYAAAPAGTTGLPSGGLPSSFDGAAMITSTNGIVMTVNEKFPSGSGTYAATANTKGTVYLPAVANGGAGGFISGLTILNTGSQTANGNIQYFDVNGNSVGNSQSFTIPAFASAQYYQGPNGGSGLPANFYGSAIVTQNGGNNLLVTTNVLNNTSNLFYTYTEPN